MTRPTPEDRRRMIGAAHKLADELDAMTDAEAVAWWVEHLQDDLFPIALEAIKARTLSGSNAAGMFLPALSGFLAGCAETEKTAAVVPTLPAQERDDASDVYTRLSASVERIGRLAGADYMAFSYRASARRRRTAQD